jgi:hypothetical protein
MHPASWQTSRPLDLGAVMIAYRRLTKQRKRAGKKIGDREVAAQYYSLLMVLWLTL